MAREKQEEGAPAYMAQFTALMTILLAFFICMLTLGQNRTARYRVGHGLIRNMIGIKGGLGVLPFWKSLMRKYPEVDKKRENDGKIRNVVGHIRGSFQAETLDADGILATEMQNRGLSIRLKTPIIFRPTSAKVPLDARPFLDNVGNVFYNLTDHIITVAAIVETGNFDEDEVLAAMRATAISLYLEEVCAVPRSRMQTVGYAHSQYLKDAAPDKNLKQGVYFLVRKKIRSTDVKSVQ